MIIYTEAELIQQIKDVDSAIKEILTSQEYTLDTGQSVQRVKRAELLQLRQYRQDLEGQLDELLGNSGVSYINNNW